MKKGILVALAALVLAVFGVPDAHAWWHRGPEVNQRLFGHTISISTDVGEPGLTTTAVNGIAKGQAGRALITAVLVFETDYLPGNEGCPGLLGSNIVRFEWGETYDDGSLLAGYVDSPQAICTDGIVTTADLTGAISGGTGRFEGASGTWSIVASSPVANTNTTGTLMVDLD